LTLHRKASSWFLNLPSRSITSWKQFENAFIIRFGDDKTLRTFLLELSRLNINKNENFKEFNQRFITLLNKIHDKLLEAVQIEYYTVALPLLVAMFVKRKEIRTLEENFEEAIKVEKDLASISIHQGNEESEASTLEKNGKNHKEVELDGKDMVILQLQNEITSLKKVRKKARNLSRRRLIEIIPIKFLLL
jgi:hypothetical protein